MNYFWLSACLPGSCLNMLKNVTEECLLCGYYSDSPLPVSERENLWIWLMAVCEIFLLSFSIFYQNWLNISKFLPTKWWVCLVSLLGEMTMRIRCKCILSTLQPKAFLRFTTIILIYRVFFTQLPPLYPYH